jgi:subtilisin family serine protease
MSEYSLKVGGSTIPLKKLDNIRFVTPSRNEHPAAVASRLAKSSRLAIDASYPTDMLVIWGEKQKLQEIRSYEDIKNTRASFQDPNGNFFVLTNDIMINFQDKSTNEEREKVLGGLAGSVIEQKGNIWKFRVADPADDAPLILANKLSAEKIVSYAEPNAVQSLNFLQSPQNEPRFGNQWHLRNTGQGGGTAGADVNAIGAWAITTGKPEIKVVVHDSGVDINHPDLSPNIDPGWDFDNNDGDATNDSGPHGTACAGVIAAAVNGKGVTGIAPKCRIVPLRAAGAHTWENWAKTFEWAAQKARIISCSWVISPNNTLTDAIRKAVNSGTIIFFASGNGGTDSIGYPASIPEVISVGASTNRDVRSSYSQYGKGLDFVAPSSGGTLRIETTDVRGANGYNVVPGEAGDYCIAADGTGFGGTSSATPLAAGIAALMLSVDPGLSVDAVRQIMRGAAVKIDAANAKYDSNGWSNQYGYGRLDAKEAVKRAVPPSFMVSDFGYVAGGWRVEKHPRFLADITGDGRADIVGFSDAGVFVSLNNKKGMFQTPKLAVNNFGYVAGSWRVERHPRFLADLTGDGRADIIGFADDGVWIAISKGDGTFQPPKRVVDNFGYNAGGWRVEKHPRLLADLTGDKRADIIGFADDGVWIALNKGNGSFQPPRRVVSNFGYVAGGWQIEKHPRFLADLTGDGRADIIGFADDGVWIALNKGDGSFQAPKRVVDNFGYNAGGWRVEKHPRFMADVTGDGSADIVGFADDGVWIALNKGDGSFQAPKRVVDNFGYNAGGWRVEKHPRFMADVTGDGRADIVGFTDNGTWVSFNNGNGTFQPPKMIVANFGYNTGGWRIEKHPRIMADITGDKKDDIIGFGDAGVWAKVL